jgi:hypothetical protein
MMSNHIVMPLWLKLSQTGVQQSGDVRDVVIRARRLSVMVIISLGYMYYRASGGSGALAAIGLISFGGVAQFLPALLGGIFWRGATRMGAMAGLVAGFALWMYTMMLPSFGPGAALSAAVFEEGLFGIALLRPQALFGITGLDPTVHAVWWSLSVNTLLFYAVSLATFPTPLERLQGAQFVNVFEHSSGNARGWSTTQGRVDDLMIMTQRILGAGEAQAFFDGQALRQGRVGVPPAPTPEFVQALERELAASVGAATANAMIGQIIGGQAISVEELMAVADESAQILEYSSMLEAKSRQLTETAQELGRTNEKLTQLSLQKDSFLSQISHELRTPMTSIRAFSEILRDMDGLSAQDKTRYVSIIHSETIRLTRLLDDLLDLSVLENGQVSLNEQQVNLHDVIERAVLTGQAGAARVLEIGRDTAAENVTLFTDGDRLAQVFINLVTNAIKYCDAPEGVLQIGVQRAAGEIIVAFSDNGTGIQPAERNLIFEKFARLGTGEGDGAGLGLAICREIVTRLGGDIRYVPTDRGNRFEVRLSAGAVDKQSLRLLSA